MPGEESREREGARPSPVLVVPNDAEERETELKSETRSAGVAKGGGGGTDARKETGWCAARVPGVAHRRERERERGGHRHARESRAGDGKAGNWCRETGGTVGRAGGYETARRAWIEHRYSGALRTLKVRRGPERVVAEEYGVLIRAKAGAGRYTRRGKRPTER